MMYNFALFFKDKDGFMQPFINEYHGENFQRLFEKEAAAELYLENIKKILSDELTYFKIVKKRDGWLMLKRKKSKVFKHNRENQERIKFILSNIKVTRVSTFVKGTN